MDRLAMAVGVDRILLSGLPDAKAERLADLIEESLARQSAELDRAVDQGLAHLPRLLRAAVKAVLFR
jgi:hypothetical protein